MNILFISADQWRGEALSALGHRNARTPNLDALASDGVCFTRHYANASPCGPSRASLLTGLYLQNHRSARNGTPLDARFTNVALELRRGGHRPALIGYTDTSYDPRTRALDDPALKTYENPLPGFDPVLLVPEHRRPWLAHLRRLGYDMPDERNAVGQSVTHPGREAIYRQQPHPDAEARGPTFAPHVVKAEHSETAFVADRALDYIESQRGRPWCLHLVFLRPHPPWVAPAPWHDLVKPGDVAAPVRQATAAAEAATHPFLAWYLAEKQREAAALSDAHLRQLRATYFGLIAEVDHHVGRLIEHLRASGQYDDTLIVFTADHGEMLGDHWSLGKETVFDAAFHVPLIVRAPRRTPDTDIARGRRVDEFTEHVDVMPTLLALAGLRPPRACDGHSLLPFLEGRTPERWRTAARFEYDFRDVVSAKPEKALGLDLDACVVNMTRGRRWKYVHFAALPPLLFDLETDPGELANLAGDPDHARQLLAGAQDLLSWRMRHDERTLTGIQISDDGPVSR